MPDKLVVRLGYSVPFTPPKTNYPPAVGLLVRSGRRFRYEGVTATDGKSTFPIRWQDADKYEGYSQVQFFGSDPATPLVSWDLPRSAPNNVLAKIDVGATTDITLSLSFVQRCFFSTSGKVYWAFSFTPEKNTLAVKKAGCSTAPNTKPENTTGYLADLLNSGLIVNPSEGKIPLFGREFKLRNPPQSTIFNPIPPLAVVFRGPAPRYICEIQETLEQTSRDFGGGLFRLKEDRFKAWQPLALSNPVGVPINPRTPKIWPVGVDGFSSHSVLNGVWNILVADLYLAGLGEIRAGSQTSFIPYWNYNPPNGQPDSTWTAKFEFDDEMDGLGALKNDDYHVVDSVQPPTASGGGISTRLVSVRPNIAKIENVQGILGTILGHDRSRVLFRCNIQAPDEDKEDFRSPWNMLLAPASAARPSDKATACEGTPCSTVRSGALDLLFPQPADLVTSNGLPTGVIDGFNSLRWQFRSERSENWCPADLRSGNYCLQPEVELQLNIQLSEVRPGGQDDIGTAEYAEPYELIHAKSGAQTNSCNSEIERNFAREAPLVLRRPGGSAPKSPNNWKLQIREQLLSEKSQTLRMSLSVDSSPASPQTADSVIVLDRQPLTVAEVIFNPLPRRDKTSSIVAEWSNANGRGSSWSLIELEDTQPRIVFPPQVLGEEMERSRLLCNQAADKCEDRIFDLRLGPPATITLSRGDARYVQVPWNLRRLLTDDRVLVGKLSYELLYGLACTAEYPYLRLAEISVLYGAIRGRLPITPMSAATDFAAANNHECREANDSYVQARLFWSRIYREYLSRIGLYVPHDEQHPGDLKMVASCRLRIRKDPAHTDYSQDDPYGYWNDSDISPTLGGQNGFKGGALWGIEVPGIYNNIVGSPGQPIRSTSAELSNPIFTALGGYGTTLARFDEDRSTLIGATALGRTTTYSVERIGRIGVFWNRAKHVIVYERSVLPSRQFAASQQLYKGRPIVRKVSEYVEFLQPDRDFATVDSAQPLPGLVKGFTCGEKRRINVDSSWGTAVSNVGWKVPLWNPSANKDLPDVYPEPQLYLRVQTPEKDSRGNFIQQLCRVTQPQNLVFYTSLVQHEGADSDTWPAAESVDFVNVPLVAPDSACYSNGDIGSRAAPDPAVPPGYQAITFNIESPPAGVHVTDGFASKTFAANLRTVTLSRGPLQSLLDSASPVVQAVTGTAQRFGDIANVFPVERKVLDDISASKLQDLVSKKVKDLKNQLDAAKVSLEDTKKQFSAKVTAELKDRFSGVVTNITAELNKLEKDSELVRQINAARDLLHTSLESVPKENWPGVINHQAEYLQSQIERVAGALDPAFRIRKALSDAINRFTPAISLLICDAPQDGCVLVLATLWDQSDYLGRIRTAASELERLRTAFMSDMEAIRGVISVLDPSLVIGGTGLGTVIEQVGAVVTDINSRYETLRRDTTNSFDTIRTKLKIEFNDQFKQIGKDLVDIGQQLQARLGKLPQPEGLFNKLLLGDLATKIQNVADLAAAQRLVEQVLTPGAIQQALKTADIAEKAKVSLNGLLTPMADWISDQKASFSSVQDALDQFVQSLKSGANVQDLLKQIDDKRRQVEGQIQDYVQNAVNVMRSDVSASKDKALKLLRAFGEPPQVPQLQFGRPEIAYLYDQINRRIPITPVLARANQIREALNALDIRLPSVQLGDNLIPADLRNFDLNKIFPSFAGLQMPNLLAGLKLPEVANRAIQVTHGWEPQSRRAWLHADVNVPISGRQSIFAFGPVSLQLTDSKFQATSEVSASVDSASAQQVTEGSIRGRWEVCLQNFNIVSFVDTQLAFDRNGKLHFNFSPQKIELPAALKFVSDLFSSILDPNSGVSIGAMPGGVRCTFNLPIPDTSALTSGITGLRLATVLAIFTNEASQFAISLGFQLSRREQPFNFAVFILGGSGFADVAVTYVPATGQITPHAEVAIACSASLGIALGPISGGVSAHFGINGTLNGGHFHLGVFLLFAGHVSLLGMVSIDVAMYLEASYDGGTINAWGHVEYKIKLFMFTLEVSVDVGTRINSAGQSGMLRQQDAPLLAALPAEDGRIPGLGYAFAHAGTNDPAPPLTPAQRYIRMLA